MSLKRPNFMATTDSISLMNMDHFLNLILQLRLIAVINKTQLERCWGTILFLQVVKEINHLKLPFCSLLMGTGMNITHCYYPRWKIQGETKGVLRQKCLHVFDKVNTCFSKEKVKETLLSEPVFLKFCCMRNSYTEVALR